MFAVNSPYSLAQSNTLLLTPLLHSSISSLNHSDANYLTRMLTQSTRQKPDCPNIWILPPFWCTSFPFTLIKRINVANKVRNQQLVKMNLKPHLFIVTIIKIYSNDRAGTILIQIFSQI